MVRITSYIWTGNSLVPFEAFAGPFEDPDYVEGAIEIVVDGVVVLSNALVDYVESLWCYLITGVLEVCEGRNAETFFPDQPIKVVLKPLDEQIEIEVTVREAVRVRADLREFLKEFTSAASLFFKKAMQVHKKRGARKGCKYELGCIAKLREISQRSPSWKPVVPYAHATDAEIVASFHNYFALSFYQHGFSRVNNPLLASLGFRGFRDLDFAIRNGVGLAFSDSKPEAKLVGNDIRVYGNIAMVIETTEKSLPRTRRRGSVREVIIEPWQSRLLISIVPRRYKETNPFWMIPDKMPDEDLRILLATEWRCPYCKVTDGPWVQTPLRQTEPNWICEGCCIDIYSTCLDREFNDNPYREIVAEAAQLEGISLLEARRICLEHQLSLIKERRPKNDFGPYRDIHGRLLARLKEVKDAMGGEV